jgi:hypothetical protein
MPLKPPSVCSISIMQPLPCRLNAQPPTTMSSRRMHLPRTPSTVYAAIPSTTAFQSLAMTALAGVMPHASRSCRGVYRKSGGVGYVPHGQSTGNVRYVSRHSESRMRCEQTTRNGDAKPVLASRGNIAVRVRSLSTAAILGGNIAHRSTSNLWVKTSM